MKNLVTELLLKLAQKEEGASLGIEYQRVFAYPAQTSIGRQGALQQRGRVDKGTKAAIANQTINLLPQLFEALAQHLVIVATQGITADIAQHGIAQCTGHGRPGGEIVHAHRDDAEGAGMQFLRNCIPFDFPCAPQAKPPVPQILSERL